MRSRALPAIAAVLLTAACSSTATTAAPTMASPQSATPTTGSPTAEASSTPSTSPAAHGSNIILSTQAKNLPPGPFKITPLSCGQYSAADKAKFGTNAKGGLVYRYTNVSNSLTGAPSLDVDFTSGTDVLGDNVTGNASDISPGQSAEGYVDALNGSGQDLTFTGCELMQYGLRGMTTGTSFAP